MNMEPAVHKVVGRSSVAAAAAGQAMVVAMALLAAVDLATAAADTAGAMRQDAAVWRVLVNKVDIQVEVKNMEAAPNLVEEVLMVRQQTAGLRKVCLEELEAQVSSLLVAQMRVARICSCRCSICDYANQGYKNISKVSQVSRMNDCR